MRPLTIRTRARTSSCPNDLAPCPLLACKQPRFARPFSTAIVVATIYHTYLHVYGLWPPRRPRNSLENWPQAASIWLKTVIKPLKPLKTMSSGLMTTSTSWRPQTTSEVDLMRPQRSTSSSPRCPYYMAHDLGTASEAGRPQAASDD